MSWAKYFSLGLGGDKNGSTYMKQNDILDELEAESLAEAYEYRNKYGFPDLAADTHRAPHNSWTQITTIIKPKPNYHPATYSKRWKK